MNGSTTEEFDVAFRASLIGPKTKHLLAVNAATSDSFHHCRLLFITIQKAPEQHSVAVIVAFVAVIGIEKRARW